MCDKHTQLQSTLFGSKLAGLNSKYFPAEILLERPFVGRVRLGSIGGMRILSIWAKYPHWDTSAATLRLFTYLAVSHTDTHTPSHTQTELGCIVTLLKPCTEECRELQCHLGYLSDKVSPRKVEGLWHMTKFFQVIYLIKLKGEIRIHINMCILYKSNIKQCRGACCYGRMTFYCKAR